MPHPVIQVDRISKRYRLGRLPSLPARALAALRGRPADTTSNEEFWALRDVSFDVAEGEIVGVIGHNGAGKSTLLKILSRICEPTSGQAELRGRVASLLEVGTGFHPELTGRENVFLNGALLGMSRREVRACFDEIVDFSGVEAFLDTPVKRYSSGMRVRLAFAVAAHLQPEILVIDEVLAVGDAAFQQRCLGKMQELSETSGRTVLFVSHNMVALQNLCDRAVWLDKGRVREVGDSASIVARYLADNDTAAGNNEELDRFRDGGMKPLLRQVRLLNDAGEPVCRVPAGKALTVELTYEAEQPLRNPCFGIGIDTAAGQRLIFVQTKLQHGLIAQLPASGTLRCRLPRVPLTTGEYTMSFGASVDGQKVDGLWRAVRFHVDPWDVYGSGHLPQCTQGPVLVDATWTLPAKAAFPDIKEAA